MYPLLMWWKPSNINTQFGNFFTTNCSLIICNILSKANLKEIVRFLVICCRRDDFLVFCHAVSSLLFWMRGTHNINRISYVLLCLLLLCSADAFSAVEKLYERGISDYLVSYCYQHKYYIIVLYAFFNMLSFTAKNLDCS